MGQGQCLRATDQEVVFRYQLQGKAAAGLSHAVCLQQRAMVSPVRFVVPLLLAATCARAELHFTFQSQESDLDGVKLHQLVFSDGDGQLKYAPPRDWQYFGDENSLRLLPPRGQSGEATVTRTKLQQPQKFDEVTMKRLAE